jgi:pyridoxamine 5'-phosphate oxidase
MSSLPFPVPDDPLPVIARWLDEITASGRRRNPNAIALASSDASGRPSVRMVLLKELAAAGYLVFYTNYGSRKAAELEQTGRAAAVIYWEDLGRQVRFEGAVVRSPDAESDAYFASRPWRSQLNAWASQQSQPLQDPAELDERAAAKARELGGPQPGATVSMFPRPASWGGYRLWFDAVELWAEGADRFHERVRYTRQLTPLDAFSFGATAWSWQRLQP